MYIFNICTFVPEASGKILITATSVREWTPLLTYSSKTWTCYLLPFCFVVALKGVFLDTTVLLLATSPCQALCLQADGSCTGMGNQSEKSYWKVHKISSGICMFESVQRSQMYLRIKDGRCDGTVSICSYFSQQMFETFANNRYENSTFWVFCLTYVKHFWMF